MNNLFFARSQMDTGWFVTELVRQPWIIYGFMRTRDAVTPMPGLVVPFTAFTILYSAARGRRHLRASAPVRGDTARHFFISCKFSRVKNRGDAQYECT